MTTKQRIYNKKHYQKHKKEIKIERDKPENKAKLKEYMKTYNQLPRVIQKKNAPEFKAMMKPVNRKHYQKHKKEIKIERDKPENKAKLKEYMKKWQEENKEHMQEYRNSLENKMRERKYYRNNKEKRKAESKEYYQNNKDYFKDYYQKNKEHMKAYRDKNREKINKQKKEGYFKKNYNLTIDDYNKRVEQQNNKCAICGNEETNTFKGKVVNLSVDHNQKTGKVRGLLCKDCNVSLGNLNENISLFYKCIEYLKQHQEEESKYLNLKENGLKVTYSLTKEEYNKRAEQQSHKCAICNKKENGDKLCLDHCHTTGKVRGLLCKDCNVTLGNLKEDISLFYKCIKYLNKHNSN